jgi:D-arginine dehydrogenase
LALRSVRTSWAGLRTFASDRNPVAGFDPAVSGFCWLAGQGGYGIQTAPALARLTAALIAGVTPSAELSTVDLERLAPDRTRPAVLE